MSSSWTFLTNHTHVLVCIARDPHVTMREMAEHVGVTERAVQRIVRDLVGAGYVESRRDGRRNTYRVRADGHLRHPLESSTDLHSLLKTLGARVPAPSKASASDVQKHHRRS